MISVSSSASVSRMTEGRRDVVVAPRHGGVLSKNPIIYCNSSSATPSEVIGKAPTFAEIRNIMRRIAKNGFTIFAPDLDLTWGSRDDLIDDAIEYAKGEGFTELPVLIGSSHGGACALHYAAHHADDVLAVVGIIPAIDVTALRDANVMGQRPVIDAAWGISYPAPFPAGADPMKMTQQLSRVNIRLYVASDDQVSMNSDQFASKTGAEVINLGAVGHTNQAGINVDEDELANWINEIAR